MAIIILLLVLLQFIVAPPAVHAASSLEQTGDVLAVLLPAAAFATPLIKGDTLGRHQVEKSLLTSFAIAYGLKASIEHDGPNGKSHSFPSGHSAMAFAGAASLYRRYGWRYGLPATFAAAVVGYSRVQSDNHRWEDVWAGAAIGIASAWFWIDPREEEIAVTPLVSRHVIGLNIAGRW